MFLSRHLASALSASSLLSANRKLLFIQQPTCKIIIFSVIVLSSFSFSSRSSTTNSKLLENNGSKTKFFSSWRIHFQMRSSSGARAIRSGRTPVCTSISPKVKLFYCIVCCFMSVIL